MQQRKWFPQAVHLRSSFDFESQPTIEPYRLLILLVHVDRGGAKLDDGVPREAAAQAGATKGRVDKERFHFPVSDAQKRDDPSLDIAHADRAA